MAESEEELKNLLMRMKKESENTALKLNIEKTKVMASSPITSWQIVGETVETVTDFIFLSFKITADDDCSNEIKRRSLKAVTNLDSVNLKQRQDFPGGPVVESPPCNAGDTGSIPSPGRSHMPAF